MSANTMLIRCNLKRKGGTSVDVLGDGRLVKFSPDENDDHVAMVSDPRQIERLLSITGTYCIHTAGSTDPVAHKPVQAVEPEKAPDTPPAKVVAEPVKDQAPIGAAVQPSPAASLEEMGDDDLRAVFLAEVKRTPHHNAKRETLIAQIEATREEAAK